MKSKRSRVLFVFVLFLFLVFSTALAQKKDLTEDDYKQWERIGTTVLSNDGNWFAYTISLFDGDGRLVVKNVTTNDERTFSVSNRPVFSNDNRWLAFNISFPQKKLEQMRKAKEPVRNKVGLLNLATSQIDTIEGVTQFGYSEDGKFFTMKKYKVEGKKSRGSGLVYRNLETGTDQIIGDVATHIFSENDSYLAVIKDAEEKFGNGVYLYDLTNNSFKVLDNDNDATFLNLIWNEDFDALAYFKATENKDFEGNYHTVVTVSDLDSDYPARKEFDPSQDVSFPKDHRIVGNERRLRWSEDGTSLIFGIKEWEMTEEAKKKLEKEKEKESKVDEPEKEEEKQEKKDEKEDLPPPGVDVWHWKDVNIQPRQKRTAGQDENFNFLSMWHINENKFIKLSDEDMRSVTLTSDQKHAIGYDAKPYQPAFRESWRDVYVVDAKTGERSLLFKKYAGSIRSSADGDYLLYFKDKHWWTYDIANETHVNITKNIKARFENFENDKPVAKPPWGSGQWFKDDAAVLLYDQYDVWKVTPDGKNTERLTEGAKDKIRFRQVRLDFEEQYIDPANPVYLSAYGDFTKDSGYFRLENGGGLVKLVYEPRRISTLSKAEDVDRFLFRKQRADESPNVFMTDFDFENIKRLTDSNPQQKDYYWAGTELIDFKNKKGVKLQGSLLYPANYEPGKKYPMVVYIYEKRSQGLHNYLMPSNRSAYSQRAYSSMGFFVFEPDIVYRFGDPGISAVECVVPAVKEVLKRGDIDENKIGLMGHSWGAYQTAFIITQTDIFSAAVAGAPLINMISMYSSIYWNTGNTNQVIFEASQGRLPPYWDAWDEYIRNSPVFGVKNITTPLLVSFGTEDGAVDWNQGVEMYNAMRRQQKEFVMLVYEGENHSVAKKENQLHYSKSAREWFTHFLLDEPAADWIKNGVSYLDKPKKK